MSQELSLVLNANFRREIRECPQCLLNGRCGHTSVHTQNGCIRYYERNDTTGKTAFFVTFKYSKNGIKQLHRPAFCLAYLAAEKETLQNTIVKELSRQ